jgi:hypothetical protein
MATGCPDMAGDPTYANAGMGFLCYSMAILAFCGRSNFWLCSPDSGAFTLVFPFYQGCNYLVPRANIIWILIYKKKSVQLR